MSDNNDLNSALAGLFNAISTDKPKKGKAPARAAKKPGLERIGAAPLAKASKQLARRGAPMLEAVRLTKPKTEAAHRKLAALSALANSTEPPAIGYVLRLMTMCSLPHSDPGKDVPEIVKRNGKYTLHIQPDPRHGYPYGIYPRLIMAYLTQEVQKRKQRTISLNDSVSAFMRELGITPHWGRKGSVPALVEQMLRLFSARIYVEETGRNFERRRNADVAHEYQLWWTSKDEELDAKQPAFPSSVTLGETLYEEMLNHPIPFDKRLLAEIKDSALGVDLYWWLTWRVSYMQKVTVISWRELAEQLGADYSDPKEFARQARKQLARIHAVWRGLSYDTIRGRLKLNPCTPHVPMLKGPE